MKLSLDKISNEKLIDSMEKELKRSYAKERRLKNEIQECEKLINTSNPPVRIPEHLDSIKKNYKTLKK